MAAHLHPPFSVVNSWSFRFYKSLGPLAATLTYKLIQMKKLVPVVSLILLTASIVYAASKAEHHDNESCHSEWMHYYPGSPKTEMAQAKTDSPSVAKKVPAESE